MLLRNVYSICAERVRAFFAVRFVGAYIRVGLFALPLPGAGVTFFAAAKKVTKESSFFARCSEFFPFCLSAFLFATRSFFAAWARRAYCR